MYSRFASSREQQIVAAINVGLKTALKYAQWGPNYRDVNNVLKKLRRPGTSAWESIEPLFPGLARALGAYMKKAQGFAEPKTNIKILQKGEEAKAKVAQHMRLGGAPAQKIEKWLISFWFFVNRNLVLPRALRTQMNRLVPSSVPIKGNVYEYFDFPNRAWVEFLKQLNAYLSQQIAKVQIDINILQEGRKACVALAKL